MEAKYKGTLDANDSFEAAVSRLTESNGICGKGSYGICFNGHEGEVIKLHPNTDQAYLAFIRWVQTLKTESYVRHFPKILYYREGVEYVTIIAERLFKFSDLTHQEQESLPAVVSPVSDITIYEALDQAKKRLVYALQQHRGTDYMFHKSWSAFKVIPSLEDALQALLLHVWTQGYACDLHDENLLFRRNFTGECEAVIIDPFTF